MELLKPQALTDTALDRSLDRSLTHLPLGFAETAADAQTGFHAALQALSMPGLPVPCGVAAPAVPGLMPATVVLLLALTDHETPVW